MAPSTKICRLFSLPQELQDEIFELAFWNENDAMYVVESQWRSREKWNRFSNHAYRVEPFPELKVAQLLVSKRFFLAAARTLIQHQAFGARPRPSEDRHGIAAEVLGTGIIPAFMRDLECRFEHIEFLPDDLLNLKLLVLVIDEKAFDILEPEKMVYVDELANEDFVKLLNRRDWQKVFRFCNRARVLELKPGDHPHSIWEREREEMWDRNVLKLTRYIHEMRQEMQDQEDKLSSWSYVPVFMEPLYPGSKVRCGRNVGLWLEGALKWKQEFRMMVVLAVWLVMLLALVLWRRSDGMCLLL